MNTERLLANRALLELTQCRAIASDRANRAQVLQRLNMLLQDVRQAADEPSRTTTQRARTDAALAVGLLGMELNRRYPEDTDTVWDTAIQNVAAWIEKIS